jgi:hypothetical protein
MKNANAHNLVKDSPNNKFQVVKSLKLLTIQLVPPEPLGHQPSQPPLNKSTLSKFVCQHALNSSTQKKN